MVIEESTTISASPDRVWKTFTDLTCWADWNTVMKDLSLGTVCMKKGETFKFCIRPFMFPVPLELFMEEVIPNKLVVWSGSKFGIFARHEFIFKESGEKVIVISRESFKGITLDNMSLLFPEKRIREMTKLLLKDLKKAAEYI